MIGEMMQWKDLNDNTEKEAFLFYPAHDSTKNQKTLITKAMERINKHKHSSLIDEWMNPM